jgi:2',3'-cyclic-nucleotide 2'-phosphodiesterase (5'-nucleotidase family)
LDAGDLLFKKLQVPPAEGEIQRLHEKAHLILKSLDLMGYHAIGIGDDDLSLGKEFLVDLSKKFNITFLSSNLIQPSLSGCVFRPL